MLVMPVIPVSPFRVAVIPAAARCQPAIPGHGATAEGRYPFSVTACRGRAGA